MAADTVTIAGHRCERGSEAERWLQSAARLRNAAALDMAARKRRVAARVSRRAGHRLAVAVSAPGYLGTANVETTDAQ